MILDKHPWLLEKLRPSWSLQEQSIRWEQHFKRRFEKENWWQTFQGEDISEHIAKITKEEAKDIVTKKSQQPESSLKSRLEQNREKSQQNRFKIVNCTRALNDTQEKSTSNPATKTLTIVDVEKESSTNSSTSEAVASSSIARVSSYSDIPDDEPFVYDIYIAETDSAVSYSDLNDLRCVLMDEVYCSYYAYM